jgi:hypothetical protein
MGSSVNGKIGAGDVVYMYAVVAPQPGYKGIAERPIGGGIGKNEAVEQETDQSRPQIGYGSTGRIVSGFSRGENGSGISWFKER